MRKLLSVAAIAAFAAAATTVVATNQPPGPLTKAGKQFESLSHGRGVLTPASAANHRWVLPTAPAAATPAVNPQIEDPIEIIRAAYGRAGGTVPMVPSYPAFTGTVPDSLVVTTVADKKTADPAVTYSAHLYWMSDDGFSGTDKRIYYGNMMKLEYGTALGDNVFTYSYQNGQKGPVYYRRSQLYDPKKNTMSGTSKYFSSVDATTIKPDTIFDYTRISFCEAYDPSTGAVFGCFMTKDGKGVEFGVMEIADITQARLTIASMEKPWMACAIDADGTMYAIEQGGALCTVDKTTGKTTKIKDTGFAATDRTSGVMDIRNGIFYYFYSDEANGVANLYAIDVRDNSKIYLVYTFPYWARIGAMVNLTNHLTYSAPGVPENATFTFADGGLQGTASFTMPSTALDGTALTGALTYEVTAMGKTLARGTAQPGAAVTADIAVPANGSYIFRVSASNVAGRSPYFRTPAATWVGNDTPVAPDGVTAAYDRQSARMSVTWNAVTTSVNKGYIDVDNVKYKVTRTVFGTDTVSTVVATGLSATEFVEDMAFPDELCLVEYAVEASYLDAAGAPGRSEKCPIGRIVAPWLDDFSCVDAFSHYTVIDGGTKATSNLQNVWTNSSNPKYYSSPKAAAEKAVIFCSNYSTPKDDWLITAPIYMKKGLTYRVKADIAQYVSSSGEIIGVMAGTAPVAEEMTLTLMEPTELTCAAASPLRWSYDLEVPEDGEYYIGFHATSPKSKRYITVDNLEIEKPFVTLGPDVVTNLEIEGYRYDGAPKTTISFNAPELNNKGNQLTSLTRIEIRRDGELVKAFSNPTFGDRITYVDECPSIGEYTYRITAFNEHGEGKYVEKRVYTGIFFAAGTSSVKIFESPDTPGLVTVEWEPVTTDVLGRDIDPSLVRYTVLADIGDPRGMLLIGEEGITKTTISFNALAGNTGQTNIYCRVISATELGYMGNGHGGFDSRGYATTPTICVGYPYEMPIIEDGTVTTNWTYTTAGGQWYGSWKPEWIITNKAFAEVYGFTPLDNNYSAFAWPYSYDSATDHEYTIFEDAQTSFFTGKITVSDSEFSALQFYYYDDPAWEDVYEFYPIVHTNDGDIPLSKPIRTGNAVETGWNRVSVSLDKYRGQTVQLGIHVNYIGCGKTNRQNFFIIDQIHIREFANEDLWAASLQAPALVVEENNELLGTVRNLGFSASTEASVELYRNNELVDTKTLNPLEPGGLATVSFMQRPDLFWAGEQVYRMEVVYPADQVTSNNTSADVATTLKESKLERVNDLTASASELNVDLVWSAPVIPTEPVVDGAEDYPAYTYGRIGDFATIDVDGLPVSPILPGNVAIDVPLAWMVWEDDAAGGYTFAHSGKKCFAAFTNGNYGPNDDWLILPRLNGEAQTISFWANGELDVFGDEQFEVYYSTGELNLGEFVKIGETQTVNAAGAEFEFDVPEGARYFAIRYFGNGGNLALFVDDITFKPVGTNATLLGYDIYRDRNKLNDHSVGTASFADVVTDYGKYSYNVVALYEEGKSRISNTAVVNVTQSGLDVARDGVSVKARSRAIIVTGAAGLDIAVVAPDGKVLATERGRDANVIPAADGVYVVTVGNRVFKVIVK